LVIPSSFLPLATTFSALSGWHFANLLARGFGGLTVWRNFALPGSNIHLSNDSEPCFMHLDGSNVMKLFGSKQVRRRRRQHPKTRAVHQILMIDEENGLDMLS
jgi:hypothetical protein